MGIIGNHIGVPFWHQAHGSGGAKPLPPELKEALVGVWIADQNTNESPMRNIIKNKISNKGGDFEIFNASYTLNSGYGLYQFDWSSYYSDQNGNGAKVDFSPSKIEFTDITTNYVNAFFVRANFVSARVVKVKVQGLNPETGVFRVNIKETEDFTQPYVQVYSGTGNGVHTISIPDSYRIVFGLTNVESQVTLEQIPKYKGAFVTDGVDDLIVSEKSVSDMLGGSEEFTVISMIHQIDIPKTTALNNVVCRTVEENLDIYYNPIIEKQKTGIYGYTYNNDSIVAINNILGDKEDYKYSRGNHASYKDSYSVEGYINKGDYIYSVSQVAWYWTIIANKVLTTDEINQVIAYYNLDKYVAPDIYYDVKKQGLTNENHAEFGDKLIDYSGNGKDMQLYNFGWEGMSGVNGYPVVFGANKTWANTPSDYITDYTNNKAHITRVKKANNGLFFNYVKNNGVLMNIKETPSFKIKVSGLGGNSKLWYRYLKTENATAGTILLLDNGIHEIPKSFTPTDTLVGNVWVGFSISPISDGVMSFDCDITIEILPEYEGVLVTDGVEDYGKVEGLPIYKDYTVIADRALLGAIGQSNLGGVVSKAFISSQGAFIMDEVSNVWSFGASNKVNIQTAFKSLYQTKYVYNGQSITAGTGMDSDSMWLATIRDNDNRFSKIAIGMLMVFQYSMCEFLMDRQLKKRRLRALSKEVDNDL